MIFGLVAALGWGFADFSGAVAGRRLGSLATVIVGQTFSLVLVTVLFIAMGAPISRLSGLLWFVAANGVFTATAYVTHYRALELGPVAVVSPISASYAVVGVLLAVLVLHEHPTLPELEGAVITILGVMLVSTDLAALRAGLHEHPPGLWWALVSAVGFGVAAFFLGYLAKKAGWAAAFWASRMSQMVFFVPFVFARRRDAARAWKAGWVPVGFALFAGTADFVGVLMFSMGAHAGAVSIVLAASAVFPLIAVTLSVWRLHERLVLNQYVGIGFVVLGLLLLALG